MTKNRCTMLKDLREANVPFFKKLLKKLRRILIILGFEKEEDQSCLKIKQLI
jgi:hypothetical protein